MYTCRSYRKNMTQLLRGMLTVNPVNRMTFEKFFTFVENLASSKVEIINLLHGTSFMIICNSKMTLVVRLCGNDIDDIRLRRE